MVPRDTTLGVEAQANGQWACVRARVTVEGGHAGRVRRAFRPGFDCPSYLRALEPRQNVPINPATGDLKLRRVLVNFFPRANSA